MVKEWLLARAVWFLVKVQVFFALYVWALDRPLPHPAHACYVACQAVVR